MDFLGIGPLEVLFILILALIIFGPKDIVKAGESTGRFLRKLVKSPGWRAVQQTSRDLRHLPNKLMREAGMEEIQQDVDNLKTIARPPDFQKEINSELNKVGEGLSAWTKPIEDDLKFEEPEEATGEKAGEETESN